MQNRNITLDAIRTLAIVLMVVFHFAYDLRFFGWVDWNVPNGKGWREFRYVILTLFFVSVGASLVLGNYRKFSLKMFLLRLFSIAFWAAVISLFTYYFFNANWIFFGVLHFIAVASVLCVPLIRKPILSLLLGFVAVTLFNSGLVSSKWPFNLMSLSLPHSPNDYVAIFPWIGVVLFGIAIGHVLKSGFDPVAKWNIPNKLTLLGRHSLVVYILHQPIFFALFGTIYWLSSSV